MKTLYINIITLLFIFAFGQIFAQQDKYNWRIGAHTGTMSYYGDLSSRYAEANEQTRRITKNLDFLTHGLSIEKSLSPLWSLRLSGSYGQFVAEDRLINFKNELLTDEENFGRALNVKTEIIDGGLMLTRYFGKKTFISPYITIGAGYTFFSPHADLFDAAGNRYHYWSDYTVRDIAETAPDAFNADEIARDYDYETELAGLLTEGEDYETQTFSFPLGLGLKFRLSSRLNLNLETIVRYTLTDYLDDVSGEYLENYDNDLQQHAAVPGERLDGSFRGREDDALNDIYAYSSISLHYNFGRKKERFEAPFIYAHPVDSVAVAAETVIDSTGWVNPLLSVPVYAEKEIEETFSAPSLNVDIAEREKSPEELNEKSTEQSKANQKEIESYEEEITKLKEELKQLPPQERDYRDVKIEKLEAEIAELRNNKSKENNEEIGDLKEEIEKLQKSQARTPQERDERDVKVQAMQKELDELRETQGELIQATLADNNQAIKANTTGIQQLQKEIQEIKTLIISGNVVQSTAQLQGKNSKNSQEEMESLRRQLALMEAKLNNNSSAVPDNTDVLIEMNEQLLALQKEVAALRNRPVSTPGTIVTPVPAPTRIVSAAPATTAPAPRVIYASTPAKEAIAGFEKTNIYFDVNSTTVKTEFHDRLKRIADIANRHSEIVISINGYADKGGNPDYNLTLSKQRAEAVHTYMLQNGTNPTQLSVQFFGSGTSSTVSSFDRRVEIQLLAQ